MKLYRIGPLALAGLLISLSSACFAQAPLTPELTEAAKQRMIPAVQFRILDYGLWPSKATVQAGRVLLLVDNRAIGKKLTVRVEKGSKERVKDFPSNSKGLRGNEIVDLAPGSYIISIAERPEWNAELTVEAGKAQ